MFQPKQPHDRYDALTIIFHWTTAGLVLALFGTAMMWTYAPRDWGLRWLSDVHVSLGIALGVAVVARLMWRAFAGRRLPHEQAGKMVIILSKLVHLLLYALLILQVLLGIGIEWNGGDGLTFFGLAEIPSPLAENRDLSRRLENFHGVVAWALMALAGGHALAALWHRYVAKDNVLQRMLFSAAR